MNTQRLIKTLIFLLVFSHALTSVIAQISLHPDRGIALIWYGDQKNLNCRNSLVTIGQIMMMWRDFEPTEGNFQFAEIDRQLKEIYDKGMKTTVQINGNVHPDYVYNSVPYLKGIKIKGTSDHTIDGKGAPMYWHQVYMDKYAHMINALADHLLKSPHKSAIVGIRQSYCAVGTEHHNIPTQYRNKRDWHLEKDVTWGDEWPWTEDIGKGYKTWAVDLFINAFNPPKGIPVFIRASAISTGIASKKHIRMVENGDLFLFQTSSEPQPRNTEKNSQYQVFVDYCKTGKTYGFMESWSKAQEYSDGWHWGKTDKTITKDQFNYWTLLCDLHCGATFPAMRPEDVDVPEYREDYEFAGKYAGFISYPEKAPGAWIAFREGDYLVGDYTYLMERDENDQSIPVYNVDDTKFGLWARKIDAGGKMKVSIDKSFLSSLDENNKIKVEVIYKELNGGKENWIVTETLVSPKKMNGKFTFFAKEFPILIHRIEIKR